MKLIKLQCPNCNSPLEVEAGRNVMFCQYCGTKILLDDGSRTVNINRNTNVNQNINAKYEHTYRHIDEAKLAAERTRQREIAYQERVRKQRGVGSCLMFPVKAFAIIIGILLLTGVVVSILNRDEIKQKKEDEQKKIEMGYIAVGDSAIDMRRKNYRTVVSQMEANGFTNIEEIDLDNAEEKEYWEDGEVESVSIAGDTNFNEGAYFDPKAKVVITYH